MEIKKTGESVQLSFADACDPSRSSINVFRFQTQDAEEKTLLLQKHRAWLSALKREYPNPYTEYRIGVYIRYFNQTKHQNYIDFHKKEFSDTIARCPAWTLVDFYVDNGLAAPNMESSKEWCRLLDDCFSGKVNLIVTQKISNVSRNPMELTLIARLLAAQPNPIGIYFISEDLFTIASYYLADLKETGFLPDGWNVQAKDDHLTDDGGGYPDEQ